MKNMLVIFHNKENGYTVAVFETEAEDGCFTAVGTVPGAATGKCYRLEGSFVEHPSYGEQFKISFSE